MTVAALDHTLRQVEAALPVIIPTVPASLIDVGALPHPAVSSAILAKVCRAYPAGGNQLEAAIRLAVQLGWSASHEFHFALDDDR